MTVPRTTSRRPTARRRLTSLTIGVVTLLAVVGVGVTARAVSEPDGGTEASLLSGLAPVAGWISGERRGTTGRSDAPEVADEVASHPLIGAEPAPTPPEESNMSRPTIVAGAVVGGGTVGVGAAGIGTPGSAPTSGAVTYAGADPRVGGDYILVSRSRLLSLPVTGPAWNQLKAVADANPGSPNLSDMNQDNNVRVLAQALVFARTGEASYRSSVIANLKAVIGTEGGSALALAREAAAYALAADFIGLAQADPGFDSGTFRPWLRSLLTKPVEGRTLQSTHEERANNWGTHAGASRAAIAAYLGDGAELARTAQVFRGWTGDRSAYAGFSFGDLSWQPNPSAPVAVLPTGATLGGQPVGGALPEEMRRGGEFQWPPAGTDYPWGALEGAVLQAEILHRSGYDAYNWSNGAILRAVRFLFDTAGWRPAGNDQWVFWVVDYRYGTGYRAGAPISPGKNFGWSDWLYGPAG